MKKNCYVGFLLLLMFFSCKEKNTFDKNLLQKEKIEKSSREKEELKKNNDPTWEETISFIKKNIKYVECEYFLFESGSCSHEWTSDDELVRKLHFEIDEENLYFNLIIPIKKLDKVDFSKEGELSVIIVYTTGKLIEETYQGKGRILRESTYFRFKSNEIAERMNKAFSHLVKLAKEKRKQEKF